MDEILVFSIILKSKDIQIKRIRQDVYTHVLEVNGERIGQVNDMSDYEAVKCFLSVVKPMVEITDE